MEQMDQICKTICDNLSVPVDYFLELANQLPGPLAPYVSQAETLSKELLETNFPEISHFIEDFLKNNASPYVSYLPLMNPFHVVFIMLGYLAMILFSRIFMACLPAFKLKLFAMIHNTFLMSLSFYMMTEVLHQAYNGNYTLFGNPLETNVEKGLPMAKIIWLFYVSKIVEFVDTLIMALKKNNRQISFLHVYHHITIFAIWWLVTFIAPGGEAYYSAALNSFIHVVMYGYYLLSSLGFTQVSFIKRYITMMQMTQFVTMMIQAGFDMYTGGGGYPALPTRILFFYMITLLALFLNYFIKEQARLKKLKDEKKKQEKAEAKKQEKAEPKKETKETVASPQKGPASPSKKSKKI